MIQSFEIAINNLKRWLNLVESTEGNTIEPKVIQPVLKKLDTYKAISAEDAWKNFEKTLTTKPSEKKTLKILKLRKITFKYAAILIGISIATFFYFTNQNSNLKPNITQSIVLSTTNKTNIELHTTNHTPIKNTKGEIIAFQNGREINYSEIDPNKSAIQTLKTPNGQTFRVVLSDGTKVYCDAGTTLQFPNKFPEEGPRNVSLIGQAFFDVVSDAKHPFVVNTKNMNVKALGTQFNVTAYANNDYVDAVLIEGLVEIKLNDTDKKEMKLLPGQKATFNKHLKNLRIKRVNTYDYTAWISQKLIFKETPFNSIRKTLERRFNVSILNENDKLEDEVFTAKFNNETLEQILNAFKSNYEFNYSIDNHTILIK